MLSETASGWQLHGLTVAPIGDDPAHIDFVVTTDRNWVTTTTSISIHGPRNATYEIRSAGGSWTVNGEERPDLDGCVDIDLGWTPATNILPVRRLQLDVGATATTTAAWFKFPDLVIENSEQRYTRTSDLLWRYESGPYDFDITVDMNGLVTKYGDDLWQSATHRD